jgi:hypothetical protein
MLPGSKTATSILKAGGGGGLVGRLTHGIGSLRSSAAAELSDDEIFILECWRHSLDPSARFWAAGPGDGGGTGEDQSKSEDRVEERANPVPAAAGGVRKGYMRTRMPFRDLKRQHGLEKKSGAQAVREVVLALARRSGVSLSAPHLLALVLSMG